MVFGINEQRCRRGRPLANVYQVYGESDPVFRNN